MRSDMGHLGPATVVVAGSRTFATIGERDCLATSQREPPSVQHTDERLRAANASTIAGPRWSSIAQFQQRLNVPLFVHVFGGNLMKSNALKMVLGLAAMAFSSCSFALL